MAVPAIASETAGQVARKVAPDYEGAARVAGGLLGSVRTMKNAKAPTTDELHAAKSAAYDAFDKAGAVISPKAFRQMVGDIVSDAQSAGVDRGLHKQAIGSLRRLAEELKVNAPRSLQEIDRLRRLINGAGKVPNISADERRIIPGWSISSTTLWMRFPRTPKQLYRVIPRRPLPRSRRLAS